MKRLLVFTAILLVQSMLLLAWAGVGSWRSHLAYHNATQCVVVNDRVYVVSDGSLYSYSTVDDFVEVYDKSNVLSDQGIRHIGVDEQTNSLVVVYNNANIDIIRPDGEVTNVPDYTIDATLDPMVNGLDVVDGRAYLSTNFGVVVLDVERAEFKNAYVLGKVAYGSVELGNVIYVATEAGVFCGDMQVNLLDTSNWHLLCSDVYSQLVAFDGSLLALKSSESVCRIGLVDGVPELLCDGSFNFMRNDRGQLVFGNRTKVYVYTTWADYALYSFDGTVKDLAIDGNHFWTCNGTKGLNGYFYDKDTRKVELEQSRIIPDSPIRNHCQFLKFVDDDRLLVAGGYLNYFGTTFYDGTLMMYEDDTWQSFEEKGIANRTAGRYMNMTSIVQDPKDPNHHYASSYGQGIYEFRDMKFVKQYTDKEIPGLSDVVASPLESAVPSSYEYTRISRLQYDEQGNLWITNSHAESPLKIMKPDGTFVNLYYEKLEKLPTVTEVLFDCHDRIWVISMQNKVRLFCIDLNGTLEDTSDDRIKEFKEKIIDQDGGAVEVNYINDIAEDHNGDIWVMTDKGPYVLYNTEKVFDDDYLFTKIKVPRNDGTNYADYLLDGAYTTCIEIDAANRKWIGTLSNGIYLIGPDGLEEIHHFTTDNSPLPSNAIESLALNHKSGELFVGTDKGLVSYMSDATRPEESYDEEKVYAYPNPVTPDYTGLITIVGLKANSHVKIVNTAGRLVTEGTSLGGSFTWDGCTPQGQRVSTGVYYVLGSDEEGNEGIVTKVLFVK